MRTIAVAKSTISVTQEVKEEVVSDDEKEETPGWRHDVNHITSLYSNYTSLTFIGETWCFTIEDRLSVCSLSGEHFFSVKFDLARRYLDLVCHILAS